MKISITCKQAVDYISKKEESRLSLWQKIQLWRHLAICNLCRRFAKQNSDIARLFKHHDDHPHLNDEDRKRIVDTVLRSPEQ